MRPLMTSFSVLALLAVAFLTSPASGQDKIPGAPPEAVVKKMLEVQWGPLVKSTKHDYNYKSIRYAPAVKELAGKNGVFTGKLRYPVRVECDITINFMDGTSRTETKNQTFHFFKDEFDEWSFRFMQNN